MSRSITLDTNLATVKLNGDRALYKAAYEAAAKILAEHQPHPLPDGAAGALREIVDEFDKEQGAE